MPFETIFYFLSIWCELVIFYPTGNLVYLISTKGARWVIPVTRGCLLLPDTSSYLRIVGGPCCPTFDFVYAFWIMITFYTLLTLLFCIQTKAPFIREKVSLFSSVWVGIDHIYIMQKQPKCNWFQTKFTQGNFLYVKVTQKKNAKFQQDFKLLIFRNKIPQGHLEKLWSIRAFTTTFSRHFF
jgi:hypothetical protein